MFRSAPVTKIRLLQWSPVTVLLFACHLFRKLSYNLVTGYCWCFIEMENFQNNCHLNPSWHIFYEIFSDRAQAKLTYTCTQTYVHIHTYEHRTYPTQIPAHTAILQAYHTYLNIWGHSIYINFWFNIVLLNHIMSLNIIVVISCKAIEHGVTLRRWTPITLLLDWILIRELPMSQMDRFSVTQWLLLAISSLCYAYIHLYRRTYIHTFYKYMQYKLLQEHVL